MTGIDFRRAVEAHGGSHVGRCYQCGTCSTVCKLADADAPFPRRQVLWAQWGLVDRLEQDRAPWLCYRCNDCTLRCPRDARPSDVMQALRSLTIERLAWPRALGVLVGRASTIWPLLVGLPILFWAVLLDSTVGLHVPARLHAYSQFVPHRYIYVVYSVAAAFALLSISVSARRLWQLWNARIQHTGPLKRHVLDAFKEAVLHKRFSECSTRSVRRWGHLLLVWGFIGAIITSALMIVALYAIDAPLPLAQTHPFKLLGNLSAAAMVLGIALLLLDRATASDVFFVSVISTVVLSGVLTEVGRYVFDARLACWLYVVHLSSVLCLFLTFPFSKSAHVVYHVLAAVHARKGATNAKLRQP